MSEMRRCLLIVAVLLSACAPKLAPPPVVTAPKFPDFMRPAVPAAYADSAAATGVSRGWAFLQAGDLKNAERELSAALKGEPAFYPAETSLGTSSWRERIRRRRSRVSIAHWS